MTAINCACHYCESPSSRITNTLHALAITIQHADCLSVNHSQQESENHEYREKKRDAEGQKSHAWAAKSGNWNAAAARQTRHRTANCLSTQQLCSHLTVHLPLSWHLFCCSKHSKICLTLICGTFWKTKAAFQRSNNIFIHGQWIYMTTIFVIIFNIW